MREEENPIEKMISDEIRKDFGSTPTFPIDEREIDETLGTPAPEVERPGVEGRWDGDKK